MASLCWEYSHCSAIQKVSARHCLGPERAHVGTPMLSQGPKLPHVQTLKTIFIPFPCGFTELPWELFLLNIESRLAFFSFQTLKTFNLFLLPTFLLRIYLSIWLSFHLRSCVLFKMFLVFDFSAASVCVPNEACFICILPWLTYLLEMLGWYI